MPTDVPVDPGQYLMTSAGEWREEAACGRHDPELFFPIGTTGPALEQVGQARRICRLCPVRPGSSAYGALTPLGIIRRVWPGCRQPLGGLAGGGLGLGGQVTD